MSATLPNSYIDAAASLPEGARPRSSQYTPASILMYLAAFVVSCCGLFAVNMALEDSSFATLTYGLTGIGYIISYVSRRTNVARRNVELPTLIVIAVLLVVALISDPAQSMLAPSGMDGDRTKSIAVLLVWITVVMSFTMIYDANLLFCCVPTIAMIGLESTSISEPVLLYDFYLFTAASVFLIIHENHLRLRPHHETGRGRFGKTAVVGNQALLSGACVVAAIVGAQLFGPLLQTAGAYFRVTSGLASNSKSTDSKPAASTTYNERPEISVGAGPVTLSDTVIMNVQSREPAYWRGSTFDRYNGRGWNNTLAATQPVYPVSRDVMNGMNGPAPTPQTIPHNDFEIPVAGQDRPAESHTLPQTFKIRNAAVGAIYAAAQPRMVHSSLRQLNIDGAGALKIDQVLQNAEYNVESEVAQWSSAAQAAPPGNYPEEVQRLYMDLSRMQPADHERITQEAEGITRSLHSAYEKVQALEEWVGNHCKYNTSTPAYPNGYDVVTYFLYTSKQGYCDSFATSLAVMCRSIGIPARVAVGFATGMKDQTAGEFVVRDKDRHEWTEVYFNGVGWMTFDPTQYAEDISPASDEANGKNGGLLARLFSKGWLPPAAMLVFLILIGYVIKVEVIDRLRPRRIEMNPLGLAATNYAVVMAYLEACRALAARGLARETFETPAEYLVRAREPLGQWPAAQEALQRLSAMAMRARYGAGPMGEEDVRLSKEALAALQAGLKRVRGKALELTAASSSAGAA